MLLRKAIWALALVMLSASASFSQSRSMYIGDIELRLGMPEDVVMKLLSKYKLLPSGNTFFVQQYNQATKHYAVVGGVAFEKEQLSYISRTLDTSAWPADEGFSVGRAMYDGLSGAITRTDSDGAKRANARIVISNVDGTVSQKPINIRTIDIYIEDRKLTVMIADDSDGKRVSAQVDIRAKPW